MKLICPECGKRIGNLRANCPTCNRHAAATRTELTRRLREAFTGDLKGLTRQAEEHVYKTNHTPIQPSTGA